MQKIQIGDFPVLAHSELLDKIVRPFQGIELQGQRLLVICEDVTRSTPIRQFFPDYLDFLRSKGIGKITVLFALGTHRPMTEAEMLQKLGLLPVTAGEITLENHNAFDDSQLLLVGELEGVPLKVHPAVADHDICVTIGSVLPQRVVGFSGGAKYLCPGIANKAAIDYTHWKSTLYDASEIVGKIENPIREILDDIADRVTTRFPANYISINCVTTPQGIVDVFCGDFYSAYRRAAALSAKIFIREIAPSQSLLAIVDDKSADFWQAAKAIYNCGPSVLPGGRIVVRGKLQEGLSPIHQDTILKIGYGTPARIQEFVNAGKFDDPVVASHMIRVGQQWERINIFLSSENIDANTCAQVNLQYLSPTSIKESEFDCIVYNAVDLVFLETN